MSKSTKAFLRLPYSIIMVVGVCLLIVIAIPDNGNKRQTSPANACINSLRGIEAAKNEWTLEHNAKSNDLVTLGEIKPYLVPYGQTNGFLKLEANGNLPKCPLGGTYTIGKIGELPTCSLSNTVTPSHILP